MTATRKVHKVVPLFGFVPEVDGQYSILSTRHLCTDVTWVERVEDMT